MPKNLMQNYVLLEARRVPVPNIDNFHVAVFVGE
jgi:hypothetical protein